MRKILVFAPRTANSTEVPHHSTFWPTPRIQAMLFSGSA
jgi:hypothetical protein